MISGESKKLTIAIWALTIVIIISTLIESAIMFIVPDFLKEIDNAEQALDKTSLSLDKTSLSLQYEEHYLKNEIEMLREKVKNRISTHPNDEYAYYYLGLIQYKENSFKKAYLNFKKASELDPTWERASNYMELSENR